jgi:hypothetical protein
MRRLAVTFVLTATAVLGGATTATAQGACGPLDVSCLAETIDAPAEDALRDAADAADAVVDELDEGTDPSLDPVFRVVDDVLDEQVILPPPGDGGDGEDPGGDRPRDPRAVPGDERQARTRRDVRGERTSADASPADREGATTEISANRGMRPVASPAPGLGAFAEDALTGAILILVLFGISLGFVLLQDRIDRGDPKLALASVRPDVMRFE